MSSLSLISPEDIPMYKIIENHNQTDPNNSSQINGIVRTKFNKRGTFGRAKEVWLELDGLVLTEYRSATSRKSRNIEHLNSEAVNYTIADGSSLINQPNTILLIKNIKTDKKKSTPQNTYYISENTKVFNIWLRYLRRAIGANKALNGSVDSGMHICMFDDPTCITDIDGNILDVNDALCKLFGYSESSELIGQHNTIFMPKIVAAKHDRYMKNYEENKNKKNIGVTRTVNAIHKNGKMFKIKLTLGEIVNGDDKKYVATMRDATIFTLNDDLDLEMKDSHEDILNNVDSALHGVIDTFIGDMISPIKEALSQANKVNMMKMSHVLNMNRSLKQDNKLLRKQLAENKINNTRMHAVSLIKRETLESLLSSSFGYNDTTVYTAGITNINNIANIDNINSMDQIKVNLPEVNFYYDMMRKYPTEMKNITETDIKLLESILSVINYEIQKSVDSSSINTLFREDGQSIQKIKSFMLLIGAEYIYDTLKEAIDYVLVDIDSIDLSVFNFGDSASVPDHSPKLAHRKKRISVKIMDKFSSTQTTETLRLGSRKTSENNKNKIDNIDNTNNTNNTDDMNNTNNTNNKNSTDSSDKDSAVRDIQKANHFIRKVSKIFNAIIGSVDRCPFMIKYILSYVKYKTDDSIRILQNNGSELEDSFIGVSGLLFLRFFIPIVSQPLNYGLIQKEIGDGEIETEKDSNNKNNSEDANRVWRTIARVLQYIVNKKAFPNSLEYDVIDILNLFLKKNYSKIDLFMQSLIL